MRIDEKNALEFSEKTGLKNYDNDEYSSFCMFYTGAYGKITFLFWTDKDFVDVQMEAHHGDRLFARYELTVDECVQLVNTFKAIHPKANWSCPEEESEYTFKPYES